MKVVVLGAGAWGSTLAGLAQENEHQVAVWSRCSEIGLKTIVHNADLVISAISMKGVREVIAEVRSSLSPETIVVTATKGLDSASGTAIALPLLPSQLWQFACPNHAVTVLSGPNLSQEIAQGLPAASVVASADTQAAEQVQAVLSSSRFRVYTNSDSLGVELGGALKNVIAIAVGACDGLQLGTNAKAALVTRGLAEMIRIGTYWGAKAETFYGLSGLGDLLATCNSALSRNYQVGYGLAHGQNLSEVLAQIKGTAEGVNTTQVLVQLAHQQTISVPISALVSQLLQGKITPQAAVAALMLRDSRPEG
ncbi:MAG: NAD(P)H-dependent glycerol-3-phosphate dehydrogenase [Leptolyngbyaceae cyanobacterium CSU_1_3]|nr:NAD(P)H-dependent glycerol-3-phosphate dehydrogenase [Leptolyngbyaceae cyanobacterium CSU_1_3]